MPSIPIQNITDLAAGSVTGNETVPVVQQLGGNYYTYKTPIKNFFYNNAIPFIALSSCPLKWTSNGVLSATNNLIVDNFIGVGTNSPSNRLTVEGTNNLYSSGLYIKPNTQSSTKRAGITLDSWTLGQDVNGDGTKDFFIYEGAPSYTTRFYVQSGTGQVGINTVNPSSTLDVKGTITLSQNNNSLRFTDTVGTFPQLKMQSDNNFVFYGTNSTGGARAVCSIFQRNDTSSFNFAIPVYMASSLQLNRGQLLRWGANNESTDDANIVVNQEGSDVTRMRFRLGGGLAEVNDTWIFEKGTGSGGGGTNILTIQTDGNVGIGIQSPDNATAPLHIKTSSVGADPSTNGVFVQNTGTDSTSDAILAARVNGANSGDPKVSWGIGGIIGWSAGIDNSDGDKFKIANHSNDLTNKTRMVIGSTGHTSFLLDNYTEAMVAKPTDWGGGISTFDVYATGSVGAGPAGSTTGPRAYLNNAGTVGGITFNSTSSIRFKKDIEPLKDSLANIQKLRGVRYNWKDTEKADIGLIAEEVNEVYPEIVKKDDDGVPEGIDYGKLTAVLIETVKELTQKIEELERKIQ